MNNNNIPDDKIMEADSISGLGYVYQQMGEYLSALRYHQNDLEIAEQLEIASMQCRACGNIGKTRQFCNIGQNKMYFP